MTQETEAKLVEFLDAGIRYFNAFSTDLAPAKRGRKPKKAPEPKAKAAEHVPEPAPEDLQVIAVTLAKDYIQRFQKSEPDGMIKIRAILKDKFNSESIRALSDHDKRVFISVLDDEMKAVPA